jgi:hypothetical protein
MQWLNLLIHSRVLRFFYGVLLLLLMIFIGINKYVDRQLLTTNFANAYNECNKIWSSRGLYGGDIEQNSMKSFSHAFEQGASGVEVDIFYNVSLNDFIVSHDFPYNKKEGKILLLSAVFDTLGDDHYFWLDFKKLRKLSREQIVTAIQRLNDISLRNRLKERIYIEGENPSKLSLFKDAGFYTLFDTHPEAFGSLMAPVVVNIFKTIFYFGNYTVMGMEYGTTKDPVYNLKTRQRLGNIPVFLYHVPVEDIVIDELLAMAPVRAFIVGNGQSVNYHHKNNCLK